MFTEIGKFLRNDLCMYVCVCVCEFKFNILRYDFGEYISRQINQIISKEIYICIAMIQNGHV